MLYQPLQASFKGVGGATRVRKCYIWNAQARHTLVHNDLTSKHCSKQSGNPLVFRSGNPNSQIIDKGRQGNFEWRVGSLGMYCVPPASFPNFPRPHTARSRPRGTPNWGQTSSYLEGLQHPSRPSRICAYLSGLAIFCLTQVAPPTIRCYIRLTSMPEVFWVGKRHTQGICGLKIPFFILSEPSDAIYWLKMACRGLISVSPKVRLCHFVPQTILHRKPLSSEKFPKLQKRQGVPLDVFANFRHSEMRVVSYA